MKQKFTVIWSNEHETRLDHVEAEPNLEAIMDAAFEITYKELFGNPPTNPDMSFEEWRAMPYKGSAILDGHIKDSAFASFDDQPSAAPKP